MNDGIGTYKNRKRAAVFSLKCVFVCSSFFPSQYFLHVFLCFTSVFWNGKIQCVQTFRKKILFSIACDGVGAFVDKCEVSLFISFKGNLGQRIDKRSVFLLVFPQCLFRFQSLFSCSFAFNCCSYCMPQSAVDCFWIATLVFIMVSAQVQCFDHNFFPTFSREDNEGNVVTFLS